MASEKPQHDHLDEDFSRQNNKDFHQAAVDQEKREAKGQNEGQQKAPGSDQQRPSSSKSDTPPGGYDSTPIPHAAPGYDVKITFHRATHLPIADLSSLSSDPYLKAVLETDLRPRHKEDPHLVFRTHTESKKTNPEWNAEWILANIPASGFKMKVRIYDEDSTDKDDRLGNVHVTVPRIDQKWSGIKDQGFKIKKKTGSKRAYAIRALAVCMHRAKEMNGNLYISVEVLGRSDGEEGGRAYTVGLNYWSKHKSPLLGRFTNMHDPDDESSDDEESRQINGRETGVDSNTQQASGAEKAPDKLRPSTSSSQKKKKKKNSNYNFQANQFQLRGPVPPELYHRYVEFRPFISTLFTSKGLRGLILHKGLQIQHNKVYNYNRDTEYGVFRHPSEDMTRQFLDMVHHDEGGRIFTYVILLDALMRFTETGKEFGIDMLSKHTMHSDASIYIAFSGEFFVRRLEHPDREPPEHAEASTSGKAHQAKSTRDAEAKTGNKTHPPDPVSDGPPSSPPPRDPRYYELIIDNDSGTYRPNAKLLPLLKKFLGANFPGIKITTLDCGKDKELMDKLKKQQREIKKKEGKGPPPGGPVFTQLDDGSSVSSNDEEALDARVKAKGQDGGSQGGPTHKLGEALGPLVGNHPKIRKAVGAGP